MKSSMADAETYVASLRVEMHATDARDARDQLVEICDRLFGEECITTIVCPDSESIHRLRKDQP